jgi:hypothetical protein
LHSDLTVGLPPSFVQVSSHFFNPGCYGPSLIYAGYMG